MAEDSELVTNGNGETNVFILFYSFVFTFVAMQDLYGHILFSWIDWIEIKERDFLDGNISFEQSNISLSES